MNLEPALLTGSVALLGASWRLWARVLARRRAQEVMDLAEARCPGCSAVYGVRAAAQAALDFDRPETGPETYAFWTRGFWTRPEVYPCPFWRVHCPECAEPWFYSADKRRLVSPTDDLL